MFILVIRFRDNESFDDLAEAHKFSFSVSDVRDCIGCCSVFQQVGWNP